MLNRLNDFITDIGVSAVNNFNYLYIAWERLAPACTMDLYSLDKFKKYKNDWNYPIQVRYQEQVAPEKYKKCTTFQSAMKNTLTVGQCFGLNPVLGIRENDASKLRFKYTSWRCAYTFLSIMGQLSVAIMLFLSLFKESSSTVDSATALIFYCFGVITTILFLRIATKWPKLSMIIAKVEAADPINDSKLERKFNISCVVILTLAFLEHGFSEMHGIAMAVDCDPEMPLYESFLRQKFSWIFSYLPYNNLIGAVSYFVNIQCTFNWNFADLFVICMSTYLTSRLEQVNQRVLAAKDKNLPSSFWRTMREDYNRSVHLVRQVDKIIGGVVFISFASNLFFVCSQLLHTLALLLGYAHSIYFAYSFVFLVVRSLAVSLTAAQIHAASLEPAHSLYDVSSTTYCIEIERFLGQIHRDTVALSGLQFFHVKRGLVLTIAGTIVTYELVLMQFTGITPTSPEPVQI